MNKTGSSIFAGFSALILCIASILGMGTEGYSFEAGSPEATLVSEYMHANGLTPGLSGQSIAALAEQEYDLCNGAKWGARYCSYWNHNLEDWCCNFLYYLADQLGYVAGTENTGDHPIFGEHRAGVRAVLQQLRNSGAYIFSIRDETPQPGDVIFYYESTFAGWKGAEYDLSKTEKLKHIGLIVAVDANGDIHTIEGNINGYKTAASRYCENSTVGRVERLSSKLTGQVYGNNAILCIARPNYPYQTDLVGELDKPYYYETNAPDLEYAGHAVEDLTQEQIDRIKNTLYGEYRGDLAGAIAVAQSIRDNVDRDSAVTYDNFPTKCKYSGYNPNRSRALWEDPDFPKTDAARTEAYNVNTAFDYVFVQGGSAIRHPIFCFYSKRPGGAVQSDEDYQSRFLKELHFVLEVGNTRFFSWEVDG